MSLVTTGFKKSIDIVKKEMLGLKNSFTRLAASMGAGLGLYQLAGEVTSIAKNLSSAKSVLKNVSDTAYDYSTSMQFAKQVSNAYAQDLSVVIKNLAKFQAASKSSGIELSNVNKIFESVSRAITYFSLSTEQANSVQMALIQMMSKGKISAEELRQQMGENLPVAYSAMARAAGLSEAEFEKMMSSGKILSKDVLPKFAEELDKLTGSLDTTSLQYQMNQLRNTFVGLIDNSNVEQQLKWLVSKASSVVTSIANHFKSLRVIIVSALAATAATRLWRTLTQLTKATKTLTTSFKALGAAQKMAMATNWIGLAIAAITTVVQLLGDWKRKQQEAIKATTSAMDIIANFRGGVNESVGGTERTLKQQLEILKDTNRTVGERQGALNTIKGLIDDESAAAITLKTKYEDIVKVVERWITKTKALATIQQGNNEIARLETENKVLEARAKIIEDAARKQARNDTLGSAYWSKKSNDTVQKQIEKRTNEILLKNNDYQQIAADLNANNTALTDLTVSVNKATEQVNELNKNGLNITKGDSEPTDKQQVAKILADYQKQSNPVKQKYNNLTEDEKNNGGAREYGKAMVGLTDKANSLLEKFDNLDEIIGLLPKELQAVFALLAEDTKLSEDIKAFEAALTNYADTSDKYNNMLKNGAINQGEYNSVMTDAAKSAFRSIAALENFGKIVDSRMVSDALFSVINEMRRVPESITDMLMRFSDSLLMNLSDYTPSKAIFSQPTKGQKQSEAIQANLDLQIDINEENKRKIEEITKLIQEGVTNGWTQDYNDMLDELVKSLEEGEAQAKTFEEALTFAKAQEQIESLKKDIKSLTTETVSQGVSSLRSVGNAISSLTGVDLNDTFFGQLLESIDSIINAFTSIQQLIENIKTIMTTLDTINGLQSQVDAANSMKTAIEGATAAQVASNTQKEVGNALGMASTQIAAADAMATNAAAVADMKEAGTAEVNAMATNKKAKAKVKSAAAGAADSVAGIPLVGAVLAVAAVASVIAAILAATNAFAEGGIVGGRAGKDKNLARLTKGEMVLNDGQQKRLWNIISGQTPVQGNGGGEVKFRIRGSELEGVLKNYNAKRRG